MSNPNQYRCEEKVVTLLEKKKLSLNALRLAHATYHYLDNHPGWEPSHMSLAENQGQARTCTALCATLCATTAPPATKDISMIHSGMKDIADVDIFRTLELDGRKLRFRYSNCMATATVKTTKSRFSMVDCDIIGKLSSPWQIYFYVRAEMVQRQRHPFFYLPRVCPVSEPWSLTKRTWFAAACRVSKELGHNYVIIPELDPQCENVVKVKVKIVHSTSQWSKGRLFPRHAPEPVSVIKGGKSRTLTRPELGIRRDSTVVA